MNLKQIKYDYDFHKYYKLQIKKDTYIGKGLCGLVNLRNTCFINSILQCLSSTWSLTDYILSTRYMEDLTVKNKQRPEQFLLVSYVALLNNIWESNQLIKPKSFIENLSKFHRKYFSLQQQDSHECLLYILDLLHKSISYEIDVNIKGNIKTHSDQLMKSSLETWKKFFENDYSYIIELFYGTTVTNIKCVNSDCNFTDFIFEPYNTISIDTNVSTTNVSTPNTVRSNISTSTSANNLYDCLDNYFQNKDLITNWKCEKCNGISKVHKELGCTKNTQLWTVPDHLIIHLKRFNKLNNGTYRKDTSFIDFPIKDLNITKYISDAKNDQNNYIYDLYAVNYHIGDMEGGHYTASTRNMDNHWYHFNDSNVSKHSDANLQQQLVTADAYILFYIRKKIIKETLQI